MLFLQNTLPVDAGTEFWTLGDYNYRLWILDAVWSRYY